MSYPTPPEDWEYDPDMDSAGDRRAERTLRVIDLTVALTDKLTGRGPADVVIVNGVRYVRDPARRPADEREVKDAD